MSEHDQGIVAGTASQQLPLFEKKAPAAFWWYRQVFMSLIVFGVSGLLLGFVYWKVGDSIRPSFGHGIEFDAVELPASDKAIEEWLRDQPGVASHTVHVREIRTI